MTQSPAATDQYPDFKFQGFPFHLIAIGSFVLAAGVMWLYSTWRSWDDYQVGRPGTLTLKVDAVQCAEMFGPTAVVRANTCRIKAVYGIHPFTDQLHVRRAWGETVIADWRSSLIEIRGASQEELEAFFSSHTP
jgi:hypothetical protein